MQQPPYQPPSKQQPPFAPPPPPEQQPPAAYPSYYQPYPGQAGYPPAYGGYQPPQSVTKTSGKIALKYGLIFGAVLAAVALLQFGSSRLLNPSILEMARRYYLSASQLSFFFQLIAVFFTLIYWSIYFLAGFFSARRAGEMKAASTACLWAALCYFVIDCLLLVLNVILTMSVFRGRLPGSYLGVLAQGVMLNLILNIALGIGVGALGGLLGKNLANKQGAPRPPTYSSPA
ncbi:hypothetical protein [Ktedonosporobacter rubrisoli]|uniref:hypothetical protein n=1 Tax=Ktedonosporobacter rubrisoli TaxID=2509675 RepID=UPI001A92C2F1|nr:hypothetical protein [Ktedonosporobacter rubrisoli]